MSSQATIGLVGFGTINSAIYERVRENQALETGFVYVRSNKPDVPDEKQVWESEALCELPVDLCIEAATPDVLAEVGADVLQASDMAVLSGSAFAREGVQETLTEVAASNGTEIYLPHAALLGIDGLVDASETLTKVSITATKSPEQLEFDDREPSDITGRTVLYDGPVRGLCQRFSRSFNSYATVALASLGLDETHARLVVDPSVDTSYHVIKAEGDGYELEVHRDSVISDGPGNFTAIATWGSVRRILGHDETLPLRFV